MREIVGVAPLVGRDRKHQLGDQLDPLRYAGLGGRDPLVLDRTIRAELCRCGRYAVLAVTVSVSFQALSICSSDVPVGPALPEAARRRNMSSATAGRAEACLEHGQRLEL
jgi:hypothetical protein